MIKYQKFHRDTYVCLCVHMNVFISNAYMYNVYICIYVHTYTYKINNSGCKKAGAHENAMRNLIIL